MYWASFVVIINKQVPAALNEADGLTLLGFKNHGTF